MGLMVTVGIVNVRSGQGAARTRGAARDIYAAIRHARSTALVTMQPAIVTYSCVIEDDEPMAKIEIHSAKIMDSEKSAGNVQSLSGEPIKGLDGGAALNGFLCSLFSPKTAERASLTVTFITLFFMYLFSVYFLFSGSGDPSLFVIVCVMFASAIPKNRCHKKTEDTRG